MRVQLYVSSCYHFIPFWVSHVSVSKMPSHFLRQSSLGPVINEIRFIWLTFENYVILRFMWCGPNFTQSQASTYLLLCQQTRSCVYCCHNVLLKFIEGNFHLHSPFILRICMRCTWNMICGDFVNLIDSRHFWREKRRPLTTESTENCMHISSGQN